MGLAAGGAALVAEAPAVVIGASIISVGSGIGQIYINEKIRRDENKPIDRDYIINQALTIPAAFASTAAMAGKILNVSSKTEQVLNGVDNVTNLSTGPAGTALSINDLFSKTTTNKTTTKHITPPKDRTRMLKEKSLKFHAY